ncbi:dihydroflavonol 4-reductase isoform X3 [Ananas comosus]|uniref:Dihydroflavonol 4-reductase isoform X3 n=1 Tax=Ananas comosus TaxID=4615 RepID=A0A6P5G9Z6_ANACO|nr:dihydroflavonol 4-reductase isoform X3 [Ananas comosus]
MMMMMMMDGRDSPARPTVCVTGATGYIGSWLVRSLLQRGYRVHATARDTGRRSLFSPSFHTLTPIPRRHLETTAKLPLSSSSEGSDRLSVFRADLREEGSFDEAVRGCVALFHVAASMDFDASAQQNIEDRVRSEILEPAVRGTINVLQACIRSETVKRVVFTSSVSTITAKDDTGNWRAVVDESSTTPTDVVWNSKPRGWILQVYVLSKLLTEEKAFEFAEAKGIELVSIVPPTVAGPFLTPSVPASVRVLLSPITGDPVLYPVLVSVNSRLGSVPLAHIEDICDAHIFLMENADAKGRYLCSPGSYSIPQLADLMSLEYPSFSSERFRMEFHDSIPSVISSNRLKSLGFEFKHDVREIVKQSVNCCMNCGFLS